MSVELIIAMNVTHPAGYGLYRAAMMPILAEYGGQFTYDLVIDEVLKSAADHPITRVFVMRFPDSSAREAFFADPRYVAAKNEHFVASVGGYTVLGERKVNS